MVAIVEPQAIDTKALLPWKNGQSNYNRKKSDEWLDTAVDVGCIVN